MIHQDEMLRTLLNSELYRGYERCFEEATHLPLTLREPEAWQVAQRHSPHRNRFCKLMAASSKTCAACLRLQEEISNQDSTQPVTRTCFAKLTDSAVPVRMGDQVVGYLQTGQVSLEPLTEDGFDEVAETLKAMNISQDLETLKTAWLHSRQMSPRQYHASVQLLAHFAEQLGRLSNQLALQQRHAEPPAIARAKEYIAAHLEEALSLERVAEVVHMSRFYFCKMFHKHTGLHFTDYVSRLRVERAKELLMNPNLRISEIAYEVGFQSLTHFNRVFRRVVGRAPTAFRVKAPVS